MVNFYLLALIFIPIIFEIGLKYFDNSVLSLLTTPFKKDGALLKNQCNI